MTKPRAFALLTTAALSLVALTAAADPTPGAPLPALTANDLVGASHSSGELRGRSTLVVAITQPAGSAAMQRWWDQANAHGLEGRVRYTSLLALDLPVFATDGVVRARARSQVPERFWRETWVDRHGAMQRQLGLARGTAPYAFVVDGQGRVVASVHGSPDAPAAHAVWAALAAH